MNDSTYVIKIIIVLRESTGEIIRFKYTRE